MAVAHIKDWSNPDYTEIFAERSARLTKIRRDDAWKEVFHYYEKRPWEWVEDWCFTFDPRRIAQGKPSTIPFMLFPKQRQFLAWLLDRLEKRESGVVEKSRDVGVTWLMAAFGLHGFIFRPGSAFAFGSYVERKVDRIGDMDSILQKARFMMTRLPPEMRPLDYDEKRDARYMNFVNQENGSTIIGEGGDNVGRGGRSTMYFVDEFAHFEHDTTADAALCQNSDVRIYASTVKGSGNLFYRKRHDGFHPVFIFDWKDDPRKGPAWYAKQKQTLEPEILAQEVDRDYNASVARSVIKGAWIESAKQIAAAVGKWPEFRRGVGGLDVGAGGGGKSVLCARFGPFVDKTETWDEADTTNVATLGHMRSQGLGLRELFYDAIGVGAGVAATLSRLSDEGGIASHPVVAGTEPSDATWPDERTSKQKFINLRAELWWVLRDRFRKTHEHLLHLRGDPEGRAHPLEELIAIDPTDGALAGELALPTWDTTSTGKIQIESKKDMRRRGIKSPDHAEALILTFVDDVQIESSLEEIEGMS